MRRIHSGNVLQTVNVDYPELTPMPDQFCPPPGFEDSGDEKPK
jgi:hypothetical protein